MVSFERKVHSTQKTVRDPACGRYSQEVGGVSSLLPLKGIGASILAFSLFILRYDTESTGRREISPHDLWHDHHIHPKTCLKHGPRDFKSSLRSGMSAGTDNVAFLFSPPQRSQIFASCAVSWFSRFPLAAAAVPAPTITRRMILAIGAGTAMFVSPRWRARGTSHPPSPLWPLLLWLLRSRIRLRVYVCRSSSAKTPLQIILHSCGAIPALFGGFYGRWETRTTFFSYILIETEQVAALHSSPPRKNLLFWPRLVSYFSVGHLVWV